MLYHAGSNTLVLFAKAFSLTFFEVKIRLRLKGFLILSKREKERDFLDLPLVADVEPSIEGDLAARELTRTDFDFLHAGLALSDVSGVCLLLLSGVLAVDVMAALMNW